MDRIEEILQQFIGKSISHIYEVVTDCSLVYRVDFSDGVSLEFHGGSVGYENANPWYEICENESNARLTGDARSANQPGGEKTHDEPQK